MHCYSFAHHLAAAAVRRVGPVLRSVLITVLDLAHVHAARAPGLAPQPPQRELETKRETRTHTQLHMLRGPGLLRSVLVSALDLAHVHAAPASQQRGPPRRLSRPKENPKQKRETRTSTDTSCHRDARSARSCVWSLFFSLSQWHTPRRRRRGGARSLLRVRELPRCCACMLEMWRCVLALQRLSNSARERAAALFLSPAHATYRAPHMRQRETCAAIGRPCAPRGRRGPACRPGQ